MNLKIISIFMMILIASMPLSVYSAEEQLPDPVKACLKKHEEARGIAAVLESDLIAGLEKLAATAYMISAMANKIENLINLVAKAIGLIQGGCCNTDEKACKNMERAFSAWKQAYKKIFQPLSCFVTCGWCTGNSACANMVGFSPQTGSTAIQEAGIGGVTGRITATGEVGAGRRARGGASFGGGIGQFNLDPYDNIYTATGCMCPVAILFNLRKLKTVYDTYACCIERTCKAGLSTAECEHTLAVATCQYWEGSIYKSMVKAGMSQLQKMIGKLIPKTGKQAGWIKCILLIKDFWDARNFIQELQSTYSWLSQTFEEPNCGDADMSNIKSQGSVPANIAISGDEGKYKEVGPVTPVEKKSPPWTSYVVGGEFDPEKAVTYPEKPVNGPSSTGVWTVPQEETPTNLQQGAGGDVDVLINTITNQLLSKTLGRFAHDSVSQICENKWQASQFTSEKPLDVNPDRTDPLTYTEEDAGICKDISTHSFNAQAIRGGPAEAYEYSYSYGLVSCDSMMNYRVVLKGAGAERVVGSGNANIGIPITRRDDFLDSNLYSEICISFTKTEQSSRQCFPVVGI